MTRKSLPILFVLLLLLVVSFLSLRTTNRAISGDATSDVVMKSPRIENQGAPAAEPKQQRQERPRPEQVSSPSWRPAEVFSQSGAPSPQHRFPRGRNASRRYHQAVIREIDPELSSQKPTVLAKSPEDGRFQLLPAEIDEHTLLAGRLVFDPSALEAVIDGRTARVLAPSLNDEVLTVEFETIRTRSANTHTLQGHLLGEEETSTAQFVYHDGIIHGNVMRYDTSQEIEYRIMSDGHMAVRELDHSTMTDQCGTCTDPAIADLADQAFADEETKTDYSSQEEEEPVARDTTGWRTIDVVVGYSLQARTDQGGYSAIEAHIIAAVDRMSMAFSNSGIADTEIVLLGTIEDPDYAEPGTASNLGDELTDLRNDDGNNLSLNTVTDFATQLGSDLISFVTTSSQGTQSGVANSGNRYTINSRQSMTAGGLVFAHELGHNMGCAHAWGDSSEGNTGTNMGWRFKGLSGTNYRTILAYNPGSWGSRIPYYSNPNILVDGVPTGVVAGYDATNDATVDPQLKPGYDGSVATRGADNATTIDTGDGRTTYGATAASNWDARTTFSVISPVTSDSWEIGTTQIIQFNGGDRHDLATIELYKGGVLESTLATGVNPATHRNFEWTVPFSLTDGTDYMIRVELDRNGSTLTADSDLFEIFSNLPQVNAAATTAEPQGLGPVTELALTFNVPMDPSTFDAASDIVSLTDSVGTSVASLITVTSWSVGDTVLTISLTPPNQPGTYQLVVGPDINDTAGNPMDQDMDGNTGESVEDRYTVNFEVPPPLAYYASMDTDPGWTFSANNTANGWDHGQPTGSSGDPNSGYNGSNVIGYNLNGSYESNIGFGDERWATTPVIDCFNHENVKLRFQRWLGCEADSWDNVYLEVSNNGSSWTRIWENSNSHIVDNSWVEVEYDISTVADRQSTVFIRWGMGRTDSSIQYCGWNIDEVIVFGDYLDTTDFTPPDPNPMAFATPPTAQGTDIITMTAVTATDYNGVEYLFEETSGNPGGTDSEWQDSTVYTDTGLTAGTQYTYSVKARDKSANRVETSPSSAVSVSTAASNTVPVVDAGSNQSVSIAPANLWTPANISIARWYDAADEGSITEVGGSVSQWDDKSGSDNHATQTTSSNRPVSGTQTIGGKNVIDFDEASTQSLNIPSIDVIGKEVWSVFALDTSGNSQLILGAGGNVQVGINSGTGQLRLWRAGSPGPYAADTQSDAVVPTASPTFAGWLAHTDTKKFSVNGTLQDTGDAYNDGIEMSAIYIGRGQHAHYNGSIGEVVITNGVLSTTDRELMEGYLAHKWGWAVNLPAGHPHKDLAPGGAKVDVILDGTITDADGQIPSATWSKFSGPGNVSFANAAAVDTTASFIEPGTYVLRLSANDGTHQVLDEVTVTVFDEGDLTPPTITSSDFVDDRGGASAFEDFPVTYTVSFSKDMDDTTVTAADFANAGTATITIDSVTEVSDGVFEVVVTPTSLGSLQLMIPSGSILLDGATNALDTTTDILDDTTLTVTVPVNYTIRYHGNGNDAGTAPVDALSPYLESSTVSVSDNTGLLSKSGYAFEGWNTADDGSGTAYAPGDSFTIVSAVTLYAQWNISPFVNAGVDQSIDFVSAVNWSPDTTSPALWLDASDSSTITLNGSTVAEWRDKSVNGRHASQTSEGSQPAYTAAALNDQNVLTLDGTTDFMDLGTGLDFMAGASHSAFVVLANVSSYSNIYGAANGSQGASSLHVGFGNSNAYRMNYWSHDFGTAITSNFVASGSLLNYVWDIGSPKQILANGKLEGSGENALDIGTMSGGGRIGNIVGQGYLGAEVAEIVILTGTVSQADRERMEGYLAHKWGLAANLPVNHPYKNAAPSVAGAIATLDATVDPLDGDSVTSEWSLVSGPSTEVFFGNPASVDTTVSFTVQGTYTLRLTADDGLQQASDDVVITVADQESFSSWISGYAVGGLTGLNDDFDGDGIPNGVESYFGTDPGSFNAGMSNMQVDSGANTFTFSHPLNENPVSDISASYRWSKGLNGFHSSGQSDAVGTTVTFSQGAPSGGMVEVTATITGTATDKVFVHIEVTQN